MLDFIHQKIEILGEDIPACEIIKKSQDFVTPKRKEKIENVLNARTRAFVPILEGLYDRGNISAVLRSAEAFGLFDVHVVELQEKFKESQRVTQGADKWLNIKKWQDTQSCIKNLKKQGYQVYTTHLDEQAVSFETLDFQQKTAVIFGNEKKGVSQEALDFSDGNVLLPMSGFTQSFNISVAAALCFQQAYLKQPPKLTESEKKLIRAYYYIQSLTWPKETLAKYFLTRGC